VSEVLETLRRAAVPRSFLALKFRLFVLLAMGLAADVSIRLHIDNSESGWWPRVKFELPGAELAIVISCAITVMFLVMCNVVLYLRQQRLSRELLALVKEPGIPDDVKPSIVRALLERHP
jgi:hypothetical protein